MLWSNELNPGLSANSNNIYWHSSRVTAETNLTRNHEVSGSISGLTQWVKDLALAWTVVYVTRTGGSDLLLLWLWPRPAATAPIRPLALGTSICFACGPKKTKRQKTLAVGQKQFAGDTNLEVSCPLTLLLLTLLPLSVKALRFRRTQSRINALLNIFSRSEGVLWLQAVI